MMILLLKYVTNYKYLKETVKYLNQFVCLIFIIICNEFVLFISCSYSEEMQETLLILKVYNFRKSWGTYI